MLQLNCYPHTHTHLVFKSVRLRNDLYCVGWGVKLYSLTHLFLKV